MKKLFIETYGCQMNVADSEVVASVMQMAGYEICEKEEEADAIFLNTCSIRENAGTVANLVAVNERKVFFSCVRCFDSGTNSVGCKALCGSD